MDRRELFQRVAGAATAAGVVGRVSVVEAEPRPVIALIESDSPLEDEAVDCLGRLVRDALEGTPLAGCRTIVLGEGIRLTFLDANGRVCNRTLLDGGS